MNKYHVKLIRLDDTNKTVPEFKIQKITEIYSVNMYDCLDILLHIVTNNWNCFVVEEKTGCNVYYIKDKIIYTMSELNSNNDDSDIDYDTDGNEEIDKE